MVFNCDDLISWCKTVSDGGLFFKLSNFIKWQHNFVIIMLCNHVITLFTIC